MVELAAIAAPGQLQAQEATDYQQAVEARLDGRPADAALILREWLANRPDDVDARLQLAFADLALGNLDAAEAGFRTVLAAAPAYADAREGLAQVAVLRSTSIARQRTELAIEGALGKVEGGARDWQEIGARLALPLGDDTTLETAATYYRRFGASDVEVGAGLVHRAAPDLWLRADGGGTPNADFRPEWRAGAGFDWRILGGTSATVLVADVRHQSFPTQQVTTFSPGLVQYLAGGRGWITLRAHGTRPQGEDLQFGWSARGDFVPAERYRMFAGLADGADTELGLVTQVTSLFGGTEVPISERFTLIAVAAREWREDGADRTDLRLGIRLAL